MRARCFKRNNNNIDFVNSEYYLCKKFGNVSIKFLPNFIIIKENEIYKPLLKNNNECIDYSSIIKYNDDKEIIDNLWKYYNIMEENISVINEMNKTVNIDSNENNQNLSVDSSICCNSNEGLSLYSEMPMNLQVEEKYINTSESLSIISEKKCSNNVFTENILKKLKIEEIKKICIDNNIELLKKSDKTNNMINKLKNELIIDLLNL
jgi:hypothetical protein